MKIKFFNKKNKHFQLRHLFVFICLTSLFTFHLTAEGSNLLSDNFSSWTHYKNQKLANQGFKASPASGILKLYIPKVQAKAKPVIYNHISLENGKEYYVSIRINVESAGELSIFYTCDNSPWANAGLNKKFVLTPGENICSTSFTVNSLKDSNNSRSIRFTFINIYGKVVISRPVLVDSEQKYFFQQKIKREQSSISLDFRNTLNNPTLIQPATSLQALPAKNKWAAFNCEYESNSWKGKVPQTWGSTYKKDNPFTWKKLWILKKFKLPATWKNSLVELDIEVNTKAIIFINGKRAGEVDWPNDSLFLESTLFKTGSEENTLMIFMDSSLLPNPVLNSYLTQSKTSLGAPSIRDCTLNKKSIPIAIKDVFINTSVKKKQMNIRLNTFIPQGTKKVIAEFTIYDNANFKSVFVKKYSGQDLKNGWNTFTVKWLAAKLWDIGAPNLYYLAVNLYSQQGKLIAAPPLERFGFREFEIEGKKLRINGRVLRLGMGAFPFLGNKKNILKGMLSHGYTFQYSPAGGGSYTNLLYRRYNLYEYGTIPNTQAADEIGIILYASAPQTNYTLYNNRKAVIPNGRIQKLLQYQFYRYIRKKYNSPSIMGWNIDFSVAYWANQTFNPKYFGKPEAPPMLGGSKSTAYWKKFTASMRQVDPSRFYVGHNDDAADIAGPFIYMNWMPSQEYLEFLSDWKNNPGKPVMGSECGTPLFGGDFLRRTIIQDPLVTEYSAIRLGDKAYQMESDAYTETIDKYAEVFKKGSYQTGWEHLRKNIQKQRDFQLAPYAHKYLMFPGEVMSGTAMLSITSDSLNVYRYWRADGFNGGITNWVPMSKIFYPKTKVLESQNIFKSLTYGKGKFSDLVKLNPPILASIKRNFQPVIGFIAGFPQIYEQAHNYYANHNLKKQVVLISDQVTPVTLNCEWTVYLAKNELLKKTISRKLSSGDTIKIPFNIKLPDATTKQPGSIQLTLRDENKAILYTNTYAFTVFPKIKDLKTTNKLYLFDPKHKIAKKLTQLKIPYESIKAKVTPAVAGTLIIAPDCLETYGSMEKLKPWIVSGNRLIIMAQARSTLAKLGFRTIDARSRQVFIRAKNHPLLAGLANEDFRQWQAAGVLISPTATTMSSYRRSPHWGNRGTVSSVSIETPHNGPFTPLIQSEFDLNYSPLLSMKQGKGELLFCQLDILRSKDAVEPVADKILSGFASLPLPDNLSLPTFFMGSSASYKTITKAGIMAKKINTFENLPLKSLLIIGENANLSAKQNNNLKNAVIAGSNALILAQKKSLLPEYFAVSNKREKRFAVARSLTKFNNKLLKGLGPAEMHWRMMLPINPLEAKNKNTFVLPGGVLGLAQSGKGAIVQYQVPWKSVVDKGKVTEYTLWKQRRIIAQLGANLKATFNDNYLTWALNGWYDEEFKSLQRWYVVGPFSSKNAQDGLDRTFIKYESTPHCWNKVNAIDPNCKLEWKQLNRTGGEVYFSKINGFSVSNGKKVAYFESFFESTKIGNGILHLEIDWYAKVWLNGKEIIRLDRTQQPSGPPEVVFLGQNKFKIPLQKKNRIVIKVVSGSMGLALHRVMIQYPKEGTNAMSLYSNPLHDGDYPYKHYRW